MIKICTKVNPNFLVYFQSQPRLALVFGQNIHIYNSETGDLIKILFEHKTNIRLLQEDGNNFIALDKSGLLTVWNSEHLYLVSTKQFPREISSACISSNSEYLYYTNVKEHTLFKVALVGLSTNWDYTEEVFPKTQSSSSGMYKLKLTRNNKYLIECGEQEVCIHDVESQTIVNKIKHTNRISALEIHPTNDSIIIGDKNGRIFFYHGAFIPNNKIVSSSMHWHSHAVKAFCITQDGTQLLSGGEEGVIVFWHLIANKKTFCPRLGSSIISLQIDPSRASVAALLNSNVLKIIKMNNFEEIGSIGSITNPADFCFNKAYLEDVWKSGLQVHPKTNQLCLQSLPGQIQLFDIWNFQRIKDIQVIDRNFVSRTNDEYPSPVLAGLYAFSNDGKYLLTVEQRYSTKDNFFLCTLKFWTEEGLNNYQINTLVEHPHGLQQVKNVIFIGLENNTPIFATVGEDNVIRLWSRKEKRQNASNPAAAEEKTYVWGPVGEITFKKLNIDKLKYVERLGAENSEILLFSAENNLVLWDIKNYKPLFVISVEGEKVQEFEVCGDKIVISTGEKLWVFDLNTWAFTHQIPLLRITNLVYNSTHDYLYVLARLEGKTVILLLSMENFSILKAIVLKDQIRSLIIIRPPNENQPRAILFTEDCSLYVLDEDIKDNMTEIFDKSASQGLQKKEDVEKRRREESVKAEKLVTRDQEALNAKMISFFPQKTHLLPPVSLIYKPLIERFLTKVGVIKVESQQEENNLEDWKEGMEVEKPEVETKEDKESFDDFVKKFSMTIQTAYAPNEVQE